jgi:hypothetical protein
MSKLFDIRGVLIEKDNPIVWKSDAKRKYLENQKASTTYHSLQGTVTNIEGDIITAEGTYGTQKFIETIRKDDIPRVRLIVTAPHKISYTAKERAHYNRSDKPLPDFRDPLLPYRIGGRRRHTRRTKKTRRTRRTSRR